MSRHRQLRQVTGENPFRHAVGSVLAMAVVMLAGCYGSAPAPIESRSVGAVAARAGGQPQGTAQAARRGAPANGIYVVRAGDSLYSIAWRFGVDYRELVRWNRLRNPDLIVVGQRLRVIAPPAPTASRTLPAPRTPSSASAPAPVPRATTAPLRNSAGPMRWRWPAQGRIENADSATGSKGVRIVGTRGQSINAAADGEVVYSGSGLRGYGKLIIVKHDAEFLSAYAHNDKVTVAEGTAVVAGQKIAEMGDSGTNQIMLYFEIRRDGVAVDPLKYLPRRN